MNERLKVNLSNDLQKIVENSVFDRDIEKEFDYWLENYSDKILYLKGARQIGKTSALLKYSVKKFENIVYINLSGSIKEEFEKLISTSSNFLPDELNTFCTKNLNTQFINNSDSILIIDEIQLSKSAFNELRRIQLSLNCKIAITGSYLGNIFKEDMFLPAGNTFDVEMSSLKFNEFCRAFDKEYLINEEPLSETLSKLYGLYLRIGGYPAVVKEYKKTKDLKKCDNILKSILNIFIEESSVYFRKEYADKAVIIFKEIYNALVNEICKEKKGIGNDIVKSMNDFIVQSSEVFIQTKEVVAAINWLVECGMIRYINVYNPTLKKDFYMRRFYFNDVGLFSCLIYTEDEASDMSNKIGKLTENFVFTEISHLYKIKETDYMLKGDAPKFISDGINEVDFLMTHSNNKKYGIEVKTTKGTTKSLNKFFENKTIDISVLASSDKKLVLEETKINVPVYLIQSVLKKHIIKYYVPKEFDLGFDF